MKNSKSAKHLSARLETISVQKKSNHQSSECCTQMCGSVFSWEIISKVDRMSGTSDEFYPFQKIKIRRKLGSLLEITVIRVSETDKFCKSQTQVNVFHKSD